jgi:maltooligosyltrehalose trehalohydrolase
MLFQGQEFGATTPFYFFADHKPDLAELVNVGRKKFLSQFPSQATPDMQACVPDTSARATFEQCKLDWSQCERNLHMLALFRDLLRLRRDDPVLSQQSADIDGAVLSPEAFVLRWFAGDEGDRLLLVNLGMDLKLAPCPEPLLAPPVEREWQIAWSSDDPRYGGLGFPVTKRAGSLVPGNSALLLIAHESKPS